MCSPKRVKCFNCDKWFTKTDEVEQCKKCKDWKCPYCGFCICTFKHEETKKAIRAMIETYEKFLKKKGVIE